MNKYMTVFLVLMSASAVTTAQERLTEHTYQLSNDAPIGKGTLADVDWLVGSWQGTAFGGQFEEVWNPASAGSMVGMWKLYDDQKGVNFYELMLLKEALINTRCLWLSAIFKIKANDCIVGHSTLKSFNAEIENR